MDLFGDLPEPINSHTATKSEETEQLTNKRPSVEESDDSVNKRVCLSPSVATKPIKLRAFVTSRKGERDEMQDQHRVIEQFHTLIPQLHESISQVSYFGVFDGHNGRRAAQHCADHLHTVLAEKFPKCAASDLEKEVKRALVDTFKKVDEDFLNAARKQKPAWKDGSTATVVVAVDSTLYIANVGDSRGILCRRNVSDGKLSSIILTKDHNPTDYSERMRIQKAGGSVRDGRVLGQLEVSRSIGDGQYKRFGVSAIPDIRRCQLISNQDCWIVLGCDGLWKVSTPDEVNATVEEIVKCTETDVCSEEELNGRFESACQKLAAEAVRKLTGDNVTVLLIRLYS